MAKDNNNKKSLLDDALDNNVNPVPEIGEDQESNVPNVQSVPSDVPAVDTKKDIPSVVVPEGTEKIKLVSEIKDFYVLGKRYTGKQGDILTVSISVAEHLRNTGLAI